MAGAVDATAHCQHTLEERLREMAAQRHPRLPVFTSRKRLRNGYERRVRMSLTTAGSNTLGRIQDPRLGYANRAGNS